MKIDDECLFIAELGGARLRRARGVVSQPFGPGSDM